MRNLWAEIYRPKTLDDYVFTDTAQRKQVESWIQERAIPHILFSGSPGTGKTTLAKMLINELGVEEYDVMFANGSKEGRKIEWVDKLISFCQTMPFGTFKIVLIDEADYMNPSSVQPALRNLMEDYSQTVRFILTCNFVERIIDPLQSRCQVLKIVPPSKNDIAKHVFNILKQEEAEIVLDDLKLVVNQFYPDVRKILNTLQMGAKDGQIVVDKTILVSSNYKNQILNELCKPSQKSFNNIRQIIADAGVSDFDDLFRFLYDNVEKYAPLSIGEVVIYIEEYQYHSNFRIDKEINTMALISRILSLILNKKVI